MIAKTENSLLRPYEAIIIEFSDFLKKIIFHFTMLNSILNAADSLEWITINNIGFVLKNQFFVF
jgi:hypothetical protein